eukprot:2406628-Prymnesium_polylepis.1
MRPSSCLAASPASGLSRNVFSRGLGDVAVGMSPCRPLRRWKASHSSRVCSNDQSPRSSARPAPRGAPSSHGWLRGRSNFGLSPLTTPTASSLVRRFSCTLQPTCRVSSPGGPGSASGGRAGIVNRICECDEQPSTR